MTVNVYKDNVLSGRLIAVAPMLLGSLPIDVLTKPALCAAVAGLVVNTVCDIFEKHSFAKNRLGLVSASLAFGLLAGAGLQSATDLNAAAQQRQNDVEYRAVPRFAPDAAVEIKANELCDVTAPSLGPKFAFSDQKTYREMTQPNGTKALIPCAR